MHKPYEAAHENWGVTFNTSYPSPGRKGKQKDPEFPRGPGRGTWQRDRRKRLPGDILGGKTTTLITSVTFLLGKTSTWPHGQYSLGHGNRISFSGEGGVVYVQLSALPSLCLNQFPLKQMSR